jgi:hypothetical protein
MRKYYLISAVPFFIINMYSVQWLLAIIIGDLGVTEGARSAFKHFSMLGYLLLTSFKLIPYSLLLITTISFLKKGSVYTNSVFYGGISGIILLYFVGAWLSLRPLYTTEHVSSTTAISFIITPFYCVFSGTIGSTFLCLLHYLSAKRTSKI